MAAALANKGLLQTEGLGALGKSVCREVHEIGDAAGLSGEARRLIVHQHDQLGKIRQFALTRWAQNRLLRRSKWGKHKNPEKFQQRVMRRSIVTPEGTAENADLFAWSEYRQTSMVIGSSMKPLNADSN
jgi:hypothetical protein